MSSNSLKSAMLGSSGMFVGTSKYSKFFLSLPKGQFSFLCLWIGSLVPPIIIFT